MISRKHLLAMCSALLMAALLAACAAPAAAPAPPAVTPVPPTDTPAPPETEYDPVAVVQAWADAIYSNDVDAALEQFTEDGNYLLLGYTAYEEQNMRWVFDWLADLETKWEFLDCQPAEGSIACSMTVLDGCMAASGSGGLPVEATFTFQDGKIKSVTGSATGPEWDAYGNWWDLAGPWQVAFRREESAKAIAGTVEGGQIAIKLCRDYENAVKTQEPATAAAAQGLVEALNSGDTDAALALFMEADDVSFKVLSDEAKGAEEMLAMFDWLASKETQFQITDCEWQGVGTQCAASLVDGCIAASGAPEGANGKMTFYSQENGTLRRVNVVMEVAERKAYNDWQEAESAWASANRADELAQAEGYSTDAGAMQIKLCQEYAAAQAQDPTAVVQAWLEALNNGDLDAALALMTPDAEIPGWGSAPARNVLDWWIDIKSRYGAPDCQEADDRLVCNYTMNDDGCITAFGNTAGLPLRYTFDMQDGKIQRVSGVETSDADWSSYAKWSEDMEAWAKASRAEEWAKIDLTTFSEGGEIIVKLCQEYAETLK